MIEQFKIHNYKNIKDLHLPKLERVNLLMGKNNVGKSNLLESISIFLGNKPTSILLSRGENLIDELKEQYISLFYGRKEDYSKKFCIELNDGSKSLFINQVYIVEEEVNEENFSKSIKYFHQEDIDAVNHNIDVVDCALLVSGYMQYVNPYKPKSFSHLLRKNETTTPMEFVHTSDFSIDGSAYLFDEISLSPLEEYVIKALKIIHPDIERLSFIGVRDMVNVKRIPIVSVKGYNKPLRLTSMGDGINRILTMILSLLNCKDGVILIDEFETGLHYSVQKKLWDIIFLLSEELNIQVFATTHSTDCILAFAKTNYHNKTLIRLDEYGGNIEPTYYDKINDVIYAINNNIEVR